MVVDIKYNNKHIQKEIQNQTAYNAEPYIGNSDIGFGNYFFLWWNIQDGTLGTLFVYDTD